MSDPDLANIPTEALADELQRRFDVFFAVGSTMKFENLEIEDETAYWRHGDSLKLLGLVTREWHHMLSDINAEGREQE